MGLGPHCSLFPPGPGGLNEVEMEWKAELQPGRAVPPIPTPVSLPSSPGLWVGLFKVIVISRVGPQLGEASGSFHLSGYRGLGTVA